MPNTRLQIALHQVDPKPFEQLAADLLERAGYNPVPTSTRGNDRGRDALLTLDDKSGIAHFSTDEEWEDKIKDDADSAHEYPEEFDFFIFLTNQDFATTARDRVEREIEEEYGWRVEIWDFERIRNKILGNRDNHDLAENHLRVGPQLTMETLRSREVRKEVRNARIKTIAETIDPLLDQLDIQNSKLNSNPIPCLTSIGINGMNTSDIAEEYDTIEEDIDNYKHLINTYRDEYNSVHKQIREYIQNRVEDLSERQQEQVKEIIENQNLSSREVEVSFGNRLRPMANEVLNDKEGKIGRYTQHFWDILEVSVKDIRETNEFSTGIESLSNRGKEIHQLNKEISTDIRLVRENWIDQFDIQEQEIMDEQESSEIPYSY